MLGTDGYRFEFFERVVGNASPVESPLMDVIRDWVAASEPDAAVVPTILPGFTDSRTFRDAFPDCVAYGFFPHADETAHEAAPLIHSADERIPVGDLDLATDFFEYAARSCWTEADKLRLGGMALRNGLLVPPTHWAAAVRAPDGTIRTASGASRRSRCSTGCRACAASPG